MFVNQNKPVPLKIWWRIVAPMMMSATRPTPTHTRNGINGLPYAYLSRAS